MTDSDKAAEAHGLADAMKLVFGAGDHAPQPARSLTLLNRHASGNADEALAVALLRGDLPEAQRRLSSAAVHQPLGPLAAPPLVYAAFSSLARLPQCQAGLVATVQWLLTQGADANTRWPQPSMGGESLPVLYGAVARAQSHDMVQALLDAGADPNDNESLYHATEQCDRRMLDALMTAGARWSGTNALFRQLDFDNLEGLRQCLALGADANELGAGGNRPLHHALIRGRSVDFVRLLIAHGAQALATNAQGQTAAEVAMRCGDTDSLALLREHGAAPLQANADGIDSFIAACATADESAARRHLDQHPHAVAQLDELGLRLLPDQAQRGKLASVRLMLTLGWPVATPGDWQASALNQAAFRGDAAMVRLLQSHGAHWSERNGYGGNALGSCLHAALNEPPLADADHATVLALLLAQGATPPTNLAGWPDELRRVVESMN